MHRPTDRQGHQSSKEGSDLSTRDRQHASISKVRNQSPHSKSGVPFLYQYKDGGGAETQACSQALSFPGWRQGRGWVAGMWSYPLGRKLTSQVKSLPQDAARDLSRQCLCRVPISICGGSILTSHSHTHTRTCTHTHVCTRMHTLVHANILRY